MGFEMSAILRVEGDSFDVDHFGSTTRLVICRVFRKGEKLGLTRTVQRSAANIKVDRGDFADFPVAVADAIDFLTQHNAELRRLRDLGVETMELDFAVTRRDVAVQTDVLPSQLLRLAGDLGIDVAISQYPVSTPE
jgi:hypothetical protein